MNFGVLIVLLYMNEEIIKYLSGEMDHESRLAFLKEVADNAELKRELNEMKNVKAICSLSPSSADEEEGRESYRAFIAQARRKIRLKIYFATAKYAALILFCVLSTFWITRSLISGEGQKLNSIYVPQGQRAEVTLQDGTTVWLNAGSRLTYPAQFAGGERRVHLEGEGFFKVAKKRHFPFIVETQKLMMKVLGTQFDVCCYPGQEVQETSLYEGRIQVYLPHQDAESGVILKPQQRIFLKQNRLFVEQMNAQDEAPSWINGVLTFDNAKLSDITSTLERYFGVKIIIHNSKLGKTRYTGKFRTADGVSKILLLVRSTHPFSIRIDDKNHIIHLK
jgi:transmembrane sensor